MLTRSTEVTGTKGWRLVMARGQRGYALLSVFMLMVIFGGLAGASLLATRVGVQSTKNIIAGNDALYAAESGLFHALSVINRKGVIRFEAEVVRNWRRPEMFGEDPKVIPGHPTMRYEAEVAADETVPDDAGSVTVIGHASTQAQRVLTAELCKGSFLPTGAVHIVRSSSCSTFRGDAFRIDGTDHFFDGNACDRPPHRFDECRAEPVPGISTVDVGTVECIDRALSERQRDNVRGAGGQPSVVKIGGPQDGDLAEFMAHILANPNVVSVPSPVLTGEARLGTKATPQITHLSYAGTVRIGGKTSGVGILIADHDLELAGNTEFVGWIITGGELSVLGNVSVLGSIWTRSFNVVAGGAASVEYCTECLDLIDRLPGTVSGNFPRLMKVCGWSDAS